MISIIIPLKDDRKIEDTLKSLEKIKKPQKIEIIVVDGSEGRLDDIKKKFPKVRWIHFHNKTGKRITIPEQMNLGLKKSKGDLIAIIGADCKAEKNWLVELYSLIKEGEDYATGKVEEIGAGYFYNKQWDDLKELKYRKEAGTANTLFKKNILSKVGYYDETYDYGSDLDFSWRVIEAGYKISYNPKAIIFDDWGGFRVNMKRAFRYGKSKINLYNKHPNRLRDIFNFDLYSLYTLGFFFYILFLPLTYFFPYYFLLIFIPLIKNIKINPFKKIIFDWFWGLGILVGITKFIFYKNAPKNKK